MLFQPFSAPAPHPAFAVLTGVLKEANRAKPPDGGRFVPEGEPRRTKISPSGQSLGAPGAHLLVQLRSLGVTIPIRKTVFPLMMPALYWA